LLRTAALMFGGIEEIERINEAVLKRRVEYEDIEE